MIDYADLIGKNFKFFGRGPNEFDCWGLAMECSKRAGIVLPPYKTFIDIQSRDNIIKEGKKDFIRIDKPEENCIVTFKLRLNFVTHIGFCINDYQFIHIMRKRKACVERLNSMIWEKKLDGFWRYNGK